MKIQPHLIVTAVIFSQVALMHLLRVIYDLPITIGSWSVPMRASWLTFFAVDGITIWAIMLAKGE